MEPFLFNHRRRTSLCCFTINILSCLHAVASAIMKWSVYAQAHGSKQINVTREHESENGNQGCIDGGDRVDGRKIIMA